MQIVSVAGKTAYLSGPCNHYPNLNKAMFELAEQKLPEVLQFHGYLQQNETVTVIHCHQQGVYSNLETAFHMADFMVMLPGWARKGGTVQDLVIGITLGKRIFYFDPETMTFTEMSPEWVATHQPEAPAHSDNADLEALLTGEADEPDLNGNDEVDDGQD